MTTWLFIILFLFFPPIFQPLLPTWKFIFLIFLMTFLLPALNFLFFRMTGTVKDMQMFERKDRILPFIMVTILYCVITYMFYWKFNVPNVFKLLMIISAMVIACSIATFFFKVSVHSVAICGIIGILLPLNNASEQGLLLYPTVGSLVIAGVVMSSRLQLNAHVPREVLVGGLMGFIIGLGGMITLF
jgi:membrane-associated phospholipid phosphatase